MAGAGAAASFDHTGDEPLDGRGFPENPWSLLPVCGGAHHGTLTVLQIHLTTKVEAAFLIRTDSKVLSWDGPSFRMVTLLGGNLRTRVLDECVICGGGAMVPPSPPHSHTQGIFTTSPHGRLIAHIRPVSMQPAFQP